MTATLPRIFTAMVTPFDDRGEVDTRAAAQLARWLAGQGSRGIILAGSTGEAPTLDEEERHTLYQAVREAVDSSVQVWMGTGTYDTRHSRQLTEAAERWGADGMLVVAPYYNKPPQEGLYQHFRAVAGATGRPVMLYNVPSRTAVNVLPETVVRIMRDTPNLIAVKEASGQLEQITRLAGLLPPDRYLYAGDDTMFYPTLTVGGYGVVSIASHLVHPQMDQLMNAFLAGDVAQAAAVHRSLYELFQELFVVSNPIPLKWALNRLGLRVGPVRLPLVTPPDETFRNLWAILRRLPLDMVSHAGSV